MAMDLMPAINLNNAAAEYGRETISFQFECHREGQLKLRYSLPFNRRAIHRKYFSDKYAFLHSSPSSCVKYGAATQSNKDTFGLGFEFPGAKIKHHPPWCSVVMLPPASMEELFSVFIISEVVSL